MSLNNEKHCREISKDKIAVCEKTAVLRCRNSSHLNSAYFEVCSRKIFSSKICTIKMNDIGTQHTAYTTYSDCLYENVSGTDTLHSR